MTCKGLLLSNVLFVFECKEFFWGLSLCVTGFSAEMAGLSVIKGQATKNELSWFCCHTVLSTIVNYSAGGVTHDMLAEFVHPAN